MPESPSARMHRARTAVRQAAMDIGLWEMGRGTGGRSREETGRDALSKTRRALVALLEAEAALVTALNETAPDAPGAATNTHQE